MTIEQKKNGSSVCIAVAGRLDTATAPELESAIQGVPGDTTLLTLDLEKLDYISSAGLRVLLSAHKAISPKGKLKIVNANEAITEIFDITGFSEILNIG